MAIDKAKVDAGILSLRIGLAITLLIAVVIKFMNTEEVGNLFTQLIGIGSSTIVIVTAIFLLIMALMLLIGWKVRAAGLLLSIFFAITLITGLLAGGLLFTVGPAIWKDWSLLAISLALFYIGAGGYSLDAKS